LCAILDLFYTTYLDMIHTNILWTVNRRR